MEQESYQTVEYPDGKGRIRHGSPHYYRLLEEMAETHDKKSHDYASDSNPSGNYHFAGRMACLFSHSPEDAGFFGRMAEKIYRLANLESSGKFAKNETVEDTEIDICVIVTLWMSDRRARRLAMQHQQARENYNRFVGDSRDIRDAFLQMAKNLTPNDLIVCEEMIRGLMSKGMGQSSP